MGTDIRVPMGLMFSIFGLILIVFGVVSNHAIYARSLGINLNLYWGLAMLGFGATMLWLGLRRHDKFR